MKLFKKSENSPIYSVVALNMHEFIVKDVDLNGLVLNQLLYKHGLTICRYRQTLSVYHMCSHYYSSEAWVVAYETIYLIGAQEEWEVLKEVYSYEVYPPVKKRKKGRLQEIRITSQDEEKVSRKCGKCGYRGHNRLTCNVLIPIIDNEPIVGLNETKTSMRNILKITFLSFLLS